MAPLFTHTLPNKLRIAVVPDARATTTTVLVLVGVGSSYEKPQQNGLSHFLEHMCFKGTERRPSAKMLIEEIESLGAVTNAFTSREFTGYYIKGNPSHVATFVDLLSDIYHHSTFPQKEIEKEKGVIVEEINMYEDMPQQKADELLYDALYPDHAAGRSVLGTKKTVTSFSQKDFRAYVRHFYGGENTVILFSGKVTPKTAQKLSECHFAETLRRTKSKKASIKEAQHAPRYVVHAKPTDQAHVIVGFRSYPSEHKELPAVRLLSTILGQGMSSRLSLALREELGAAYYVYAHQESYCDHGVFSIAAGIDKTRFSAIIERIVEECRLCKKELISLQELSKAKEYTIGALRIGLESSDDVASFYGSQMVMRQKVRTPEQLIASIQKVSVKDIRRVAQALFVPERLTMITVGPFAQKDIPKAAVKRLSL